MRIPAASMCCALLVLALAETCPIPADLAAFSRPRYPAAAGDRDRALAVGWHDEMGRDSVRRWMWCLPGGGADVSAPRPGVIRLRLGGHCVYDHTGPKAYYWATAARFATVDLDRYPVLSVRTIRLAGSGPWWDVKVREYLGGENYGREVGVVPAESTRPGLLLYDVGKEMGLTGVRTLRIRLNVAALNPGGSVDYDYVRFIRREDAAWLKERPGFSHAIELR